jgi:hypothetical protein
MEQEIEKLFSFDLEYGRHGNLYGLFVSTQEAVDGIIGREARFGEVLGKHSDVSAALERDHFKVSSEEPGLIRELKHAFRGCNICGYNPFDYLAEEEEAE